MNKRHRKILDAFKALGGEATLKQVAAAAGLNVNGVSQSMSATALKEILEDLGGKGGERIYRLRRPYGVQLSLL